MNYQDLNTDLIKKAIAEEATPALANYWSLQYASLFDKRVNYDRELDKAYINLTSHMTLDGKDIDHQLLQQTITVLIRFLDALSMDTKERKIRLSVNEFEEFLKQTDTTEQIGIDYVGSLVADFAYRASENIAQEKGAYPSFQQDMKDLRPVEFEMWEDDKENFKSGLELSKIYDANTIITSPWKLIARRNKAILDFPQEPEQWHNWTDKYGFISNLVHSNKIENKPESELNEEKIIEIPDVTEINDDELAKLTEDFNDVEQNSTPAHSDEFAPAELKLQDEAEIPDFDLGDLNLDESETETSNLENSPAAVQIPIESESTTSNITVKMDSSPEIPADDLVSGQLIKIKDQTSPYFGKIFQIVEITSDHKYRLGGTQDKVFEELWNSDQLEDVDLYEILDLLNEKVSALSTSGETSQPQLEPGVDYTLCKSAVMVINPNDELLLVKSDKANWTLPHSQISLNEIPEQSIMNFINSQLEGNFRILDEVGSVMTVHRPGDATTQNCIYNVFLVHSDNDEIKQSVFSNPDLSFQYHSLSSLPATEVLVRIGLDKYNRRMSLAQPSSSIKPVPEPNFSEEQENIPVQESSDFTDSDFPLNLHNNNLNNNSSQNTTDMTTKYVLKLQQIVSTNLFGNVALTLQYNSQGISAIVLDQAMLNPELQAAVDVIMGLINFMLQHSVPVRQSAELLHTKDADASLQINQFLEIIADSLSKAPETIGSMDHSMLE
ncbi:MAG: hypothetical protein OHK0017_04630 [Patescibacteria group bacterium]